MLCSRSPNQAQAVLAGWGKEYWIGDWQQQTVEVYRRSQARLERVATLFTDDSLTPPLFEGFSLKVTDIFN
ncbi:MAG: Uma2 family endonuclease [Cyanophyceae cyanobacterium]